MNQYTKTGPSSADINSVHRNMAKFGQTRDAVNRDLGALMIL
jgi:hypothetical protein